jgi:hypothetical protein
MAYAHGQGALCQDLARFIAIRFSSSWCTSTAGCKAHDTIVAMANLVLDITVLSMLLFHTHRVTFKFTLTGW